MDLEQAKAQTQEKTGQLALRHLDILGHILSGCLQNLDFSCCNPRNTVLTRKWVNRNEILSTESQVQIHSSGMEAITQNCLESQAEICFGQQGASHSKITPRPVSSPCLLEDCGMSLFQLLPRQSWYLAWSCSESPGNSYHPQPVVFSPLCSWSCKAAAVEVPAPLPPSFPSSTGAPLGDKMCYKNYTFGQEIGERAKTFNGITRACSFIKARREDAFWTWGCMAKCSSPGWSHTPLASGCRI